MTDHSQLIVMGIDTQPPQIISKNIARYAIPERLRAEFDEIFDILNWPLCADER